MGSLIEAIYLCIPEKPHVQEVLGADLALFHQGAAAVAFVGHRLTRTRVVIAHSNRCSCASRCEHLQYKQSYYYQLWVLLPVVLGDQPEQTVHISPRRCSGHPFNNRRFRSVERYIVTPLKEYSFSRHIRKKSILLHIHSQSTSFRVTVLHIFLTYL